MLHRLLILGCFLMMGGFAQAAERPVQLASVDPGQFLPSPDALIGRTLEAIRSGKLDEALKEVDRVIAQRPDFKLAHLIKGDLLLARSKPLPTLGAVRAKGSAEQSLADLRDEARLRLLRHIDQPDPTLLPKNLLQIPSSEKYVLLADTSRARLYLFENINGEPRLKKDYYLTIGRNGTDKRIEGDKRTPIGVYTITQELPRDKLGDLYGTGAFPINYPNELDQAQGRGGHGIWLHGTPSNTYNRAPRASDGCLVLTNPDLTEIGQWVQPGTTMVITDRVDWVDYQTWATQRQQLLNKLGQWKGDWETRNPDHFLQHYASSFLQGQGRGWADSKRRNILDKSWIRIALSDVGVYLYAGDNMAVVNFQQDYASDKMSDGNRKRLYLQQENAQWQIVLEKSIDNQKRVASLAR